MSLDIAVMWKLENISHNGIIIRCSWILEHMCVINNYFLHLVFTLI